jgi:protein phosphatase
LAAGAPDNVTVIVADIMAADVDDVEQPLSAPAAAASVTASAAARTPVTSVSRPESPTAKAAPLLEEDDDGGTPSAAEAAAQAAAGPETAVGYHGEPLGREPLGDEGSLPEDIVESGVRREMPTDPNLGAHLSAEVLRRELDSRPHELVGAAASAAETGSLPSVASRTAARRAAALLTHRASDADVEVEEAEVEPDSNRQRIRRWIKIVLAAIIALAIVLGLWLGYAWTQTRYYVGAFNNHVAIYNGVSQTLGPISLSRVYTSTDIPMSSLPDFQQQKLRAGVPAESLTEAQDIVANIRSHPDACLSSPSSAGSAKASPSASASPSATPSPSPPSASASASPSPTNPCLGGQQ